MEAAGKRYFLHPSRSDEVHLYNLADLHRGNRAASLERLQADITRIDKDPFAVWLGGGDYAEYISPGDKRFDADCVDDKVLKASDYGKLGTALTTHVKTLFWPIRKKCLGLLFGNHEATYQRTKEQSEMHAGLCASLEVPNLGNLGYCALFDLVCVRYPRKWGLVSECPCCKNGTAEGYTRTSFRIFAHHGAGGATTFTGRMSRLRQFMESFEADIFMVGHVHGRSGDRMPILGANDACTEIVQREKIGVITGGYLRTYAQGVTGYGEIRGYRPSVLGAAFVTIRPETRDVRAEI